MPVPVVPVRVHVPVPKRVALRVPVRVAVWVPVRVPVRVLVWDPGRVPMQMPVRVPVSRAGASAGSCEHLKYNMDSQDKVGEATTRCRKIFFPVACTVWVCNTESQLNMSWYHYLGSLWVW